MWCCEICDSLKYEVVGESVICSKCLASFPLDSRVETVTVDDIEDTGWKTTVHMEDLL